MFAVDVLLKMRDTASLSTSPIKNADSCPRVTANATANAAHSRDVGRSDDM